MASSSKGKRARVAVSSQSNARSAFEHPQVRIFFKQTMEGKGIVTDSSIERYDGGIGPIDEINRPLINLDWQYFGKEPAPTMSRFLIWEFYAHAWYRETQEPGCRKSWVRGVEIPYDQHTIAQVLELPDFDAPTDFVDYYRRDTLDPRTFEDIRNSLFLPGKDWNRGSNDSIKHVFVKDLRPVARFWAHFVMHNLYPQSHETEVKPAILRIVYGIMQGMRVDAAFLMSDYIFHQAREKCPGYVGLPWVITQLCNHFEVPIGDDLLDLRRTGRMGKSHYDRYVRIVRRENAAAAAPADPEPAAAAPAHPAGPSAPVSPSAPQHHGPDDTMLKMMERMLRYQKQQRTFNRAMMQRTQLYEDQMRDLCDHMGVPFRIPPLTPAELSMLDSSSSDDAHGAGDDVDDDEA